MEKNTFKHFISKIIKFIIILLVADFIFGFFAKQIYFNQKTGKNARITKSINIINDEILFFGSSHANTHYVPSVFEEKLKMSCYNTGVRGQGILFQSILLKMILQRTKPKLIILNIDENSLYESNITYDRLQDIIPYYSDFPEIIKPFISMKSNLIALRLFFKSYQYNSTLVHAIKYYFSPQKDYKGYLPLYEKMKPIKPNKTNVTSNKIKNLDKVFIEALNSFISASKELDFQLIFVQSPNLLFKDFSGNASLNKVKLLSKQADIPFIDFSNNNNFINKFDLFYDTTHLNNEGAHLFSNIIADKIKNDNILLKY